MAEGWTEGVQATCQVAVRESAGPRARVLARADGAQPLPRVDLRGHASRAHAVSFEAEEFVCGRRGRAAQLGNDL